MHQLDECISEIEFLKNELIAYGQEHRRLGSLHSEITTELNANTRKIAQFQEAIRILNYEKKFFESGGSKDNLPVMKAMG